MIRRDHPLHARRAGQNAGVGVALVALIGIVFALTVVKITEGQPMQAFDHVARPEMVPQ